MRFVLLVLILANLGCSSLKREIYKMKNDERMLCRHDSAICILVYGEKYKVRAVIGHLRHGRHSQAQALINGRWEWLHAFDGVVGIVEKDYEFHQEYTIEGRTFIDTIPRK